MIKHFFVLCENIMLILWRLITFILIYSVFTIQSYYYFSFLHIYSVEDSKIRKNLETQIKELNSFKEDSELNVTTLENQIKKLEEEKNKLLKELGDTNSVLILGMF